jgi:prevent-host-death family protein
MLDLREVFSVTDFLRNHREHIAKLQESGKPVVLTVKGKPAVVMQDAAGYQSLLDELEKTKHELDLERKTK